MTPTGPRPRGSPCRHPRVSRLLHTQSCSLQSCRGRPLEEISSYTLRPTRCPAMQGCSRRPGCSARPAPAHPVLGSRRSALWVAAPCPAGGETGPHGGTSVCSRQPQPSGGVSARWAPGATGCFPWGGRGLETGSGLVDFGPLCFRVENLELEASTPRPHDRSGQAGRRWLEEGAAWISGWASGPRLVNPPRVSTGKQTQPSRLPPREPVPWEPPLPQLPGRRLTGPGAACVWLKGPRDQAGVWPGRCSGAWPRPSWSPQGRGRGRALESAEPRGRAELRQTPCAWTWKAVRPPSCPGPCS